MKDVLTFGRGVVSSHKYSVGVASIVEMTENMYAVLATDKDGWLLYSRNFAFTDNCKKEVMKDCRRLYNSVRAHMSKKRLDLLDTLDD